jgi:hypothetical protein
MISDQELLAGLRDMWEATDPMPGDLVERVHFTLQLEDLEVELMRLHEAIEPVGARGGEPTGTRGGTETASTVTFSSETLTVMLTISGDGAALRRIDGWIAPAAALRVELRRDEGTAHTMADDDGRFSFDDVPAGLVQLLIEPTDGATVTLARPVVTPAVQI